MFLQLTLAVLVQGVAGQLCPLVPIMPDTFIFRREMFTFWATETIYNGETFFSKVEQRPSILGKSSSVLVMPGLNVVGSSSKSFCLPWNYCNFEVYDCNGQVVYRGEVGQVASVSDPTSQVTVYKLLDKEGNYLGRSTALPSLLPRLGGINSKSQSAVSIRDTGDAIVLDLRRDPNQLWVTHWTGTLNAPGMSGFGNAEKVPLADPVLVTFLISNNFRNKGLFSPLVNFFLLAMAAGLVVFLYWRYQHSKEEEEEEYDIRNLQIMDSLPLLEDLLAARRRQGPTGFEQSENCSQSCSQTLQLRGEAWAHMSIALNKKRERELAKAENVRLRERVKKLNMIQNNLLKQVSMLMTEREELKRLERRKSPRGKTSSLTSSCTSLGAPGMSFDRMAELNAFVKNGAHKNGDAKVQEPFEEMLREVEAGAQDSPERSVSESVRSRNSQELLRQIRQQTCCYAATRAAVSPRPVSPGLRRRDPGIPSYADVMALPLKESGCGSPEKQDDLMQSFVQHFAAYTRQNDASPAS
ncbi:Uncharacterized protein SCF082_LOCUS9217 [Durusdinium trenchii]|uniref:Uncharacterized protein n=1 Tax=Durusdinium trenchii TaxID=1381693 RepID=A0ABP0IXW4_9DINO